jgi:YD repeat-containing protein
LKAYKATDNLKCISLTYEIGKTYTFEGEIELKYSGFHFCPRAGDTLRCSDYRGKSLVIVEVEVLGNIKWSEWQIEGVTDKLKVIRVLPKEEYLSNHINLYEYNSFGSVTKLTEAYGGVTEFEYDVNNNLIKKTTTLMPFFTPTTYSYEYDNRNNLVKIFFNGKEIESYEYDLKNNRIKTTYSSGRVLSVKIDD